MRAVHIGLVVGGLLLASSAANAQTNQIKPRVMIMLDTSGSMTEHIDSNTNSFADGSIEYLDSVITRDKATYGSEGLYVGRETGTAMCPANAAAAFDGVNSRLYNGKAAITNVINGSGDIDWGLMRYTGFDCPLVNTFTQQGNVNCTNDEACPTNQFCNTGTGKCGTVDNLCELSGYGGTDKRGGAGCGNHYDLPVTYGGDAVDNKDATDCGTGAAAGNAACATPQTCYVDADCNGGTAGSCVALPGTAAKACKCTGGPTCDGTIYTCGAGNFCRYAKGCQSIGGQILVDPAAPTFANVQVLPYVDNVEDYHVGSTRSGATASVVAGATCTGCVRLTGLTGMAITDLGKAIQLSGANSGGNNGYFTIVNFVSATSVDIHNSTGVTGDTKNGTINWNVKYPVNPELRAITNTPLAGAARSATSWYNSVIGSDPQAQCRPYVLVQITDGFDTCDPDAGNGPIAAAQSFVAATVTGKPSKPLNKVYMIGLNLSSPTLDAVAKAGGTNQARLATSQQDIEAALADIVASSVLVEKCNDIDDNCNNQCDENFPDVAVDNAKDPTCTPRAAKACNNGYPSGSQCFDSGIFVCSTDQLSEVCSAQVCTGAAGGTITSPAAGVMRVSNVNGITANMIGQLLVVRGSAKAGNNGAFVITAVGGGTVDVTNAGVTVPDASVVSYGVPSTQGSATITRPVAGTERLTVTTSAGVNVGDQITVVNATPVADNGTYTVTAVTATTIDLANANAVNGTAPGLWEDPRLCPGVEVCDGQDNDCNGIIDDCTVGVPGSCCMSCQPTSEICNGKDDNCNGIIDDNPIDAGGICNGNNVGDCAPSHFECCTTDPNTSTCVQGATDKLWCMGGNPGYPKPTDLCDGTDDNCNGTPNDGPPQVCYTNSAGMVILTPAQDGVGACHAGTQLCTTAPLPAGDPGCPPGWPAGKVCPNPTHTYGTCTGAVGPQNEACNGIDDDCDGVVDDNLKDPWADPSNPAYPTAHPCCSTGNLADCMGANGSPCKVGGFQCVGGMKVCVGSVPKSNEICDKIDNDCNGSVDDLPGRGTACTGPGINTTGTCTAQNDCLYAPDPNASPNLVCVQKTFPGMETCNGLDDNCNGQIDDNNPPNAVNPLPGVGVPCMVPMPPADKPPCKAGTTVCVAGTIVCQGAVGPTPNQCNGISTDCTGNPNTNGNCPTGFQCYQGNCVAPCQPGEFPCPGGYACNQNTNSCDINGVHNGCCVPDACANLTCPPGFNCQLDANGNASCSDPCAKVTCPPSYVCKLGTCVDGSCRTQGCPDGQVCVNDPTSNMFVCQPDPCAGVMCDANQFCQGGVCVGTCAGPCPNGQYCSKGQCVPDPCAHTPCVEGQVCQVQNGVGVCVENQCQFGCNLGQACCGGECVADGCENLHCPEDTHCRLTPDCAATCETNPASPKDQVVGAGGGGFGCAVAGSASDSSSLAWLIVVAGALLFRRRRTAEVRK